jgi:hypothetical protein
MASLRIMARAEVLTLIVELCKFRFTLFADIRLARKHFKTKTLQLILVDKEKEIF